jgi:F-type H+-transporting ATPase subunit b
MIGLLSDTNTWAMAFVLIFLGVLAYFGVFKMVGGSLDARAARIEKELEDAKRLREEAQSLLAEYQRKARDADKEAADIISKAKEDAIRMRAEAEKQLADTIERRTKAAEQKIAQAETRALADVRSVAADVAVQAAERVLRSRVGTGLGADLVEKSIEDVKARLH